jgi:hypothetical protein
MAKVTSITDRITQRDGDIALARTELDHLVDLGLLARPASGDGYILTRDGATAGLRLLSILEAVATAGGWPWGHPDDCGAAFVAVEDALSP